jgi:ATP-binding cassette subfamily B (MDR/TAP) protein 1
MSFGAIMEMKMYMGEDAVAEEKGERTPGAIVVETLLNMRTVASLSMEAARAEEFDEALASEDPRPVLSNALKGSASGLGQFVQMWGCKYSLLNQSLRPYD